MINLWAIIVTWVPLLSTHTFQWQPRVVPPLLSCSRVMRITNRVKGYHCLYWVAYSCGTHSG